MDNSLRKLLLENPDLPIMVCCGENANSGEWHYECHFDHRCNIVECTWFDNKYFDDKNELLDYVIDNVISDDEFKKLNFENISQARKYAEEYLKLNNVKFEKYIQIYVG